MFVDDELYQAYIEEMQKLEHFRSSRDVVKNTPLVTNDPYTKRLIEALAFFGARAKRQSEKTVSRIHQNLFYQFFPYLLNPLPAMAMIGVNPSPNHPESVRLEVGTELNFNTNNQFKAHFQTLETIDIDPIRLQDFDFIRREDHGWLCKMQFQALHPTHKQPKPLRLYISHLRSLYSSFRTLFAIEHHLEKIEAYFDDLCDQAQLCHHTWGPSTTHRILNHPLERLRSLMRMPQQELFLTCELPKTEEKWHSFTICIYLNQNWPTSLMLSKDTFIPFVTPALNLKSEHADPIICDGTKDQYPILHPDPSLHLELHTVKSVNQILSTGSKPLKPGILSLKGNTYDVNYFDKMLKLDIEGAFNKPETVTIEALWSQPEYTEHIDEHTDIQFRLPEMLHSEIDLMSKIYPYERYRSASPTFLLDVFSLKNQDALTKDQLLFLLNIAKNLNRSVFDFIPDLISDMKVTNHEHASHLGANIEYEFWLKDWGGQKWEIVVLFFTYVNRFLNAWLTQFGINTIIHFPQAKQPLKIEGDKNNDLSILARNFHLS